MATAMFAAGCFWGVEHTFRQLPGVNEAISGYSGGTTVDPTYQQVCSGATGHAETVLVDYDPAKISFEELVQAFWRLHDPTQRNRQGPDVGTQYRSAIYVADEQERAQAEASRDAEEESGRHNRPIATEITAAGPFYAAEEYHQRYFEKHGIKGCHL